MAAGPILSVLAQIPWGQVLEKAPAIADGAGRLWRSVSRRRAGDGVAARVESAADLADQGSAAAHPWAPRLRAAEQDIAQLHEQMQAASALIRDLTEQNAQLIRRIDQHHRWLLRLVWAAGLAGVTLALSWAVLLGRLP
ncbi:MAG: hypothetical protein AB9M60_21585 [Leptothrix sp. (in: b-proteobacteria)]